MPLGSIAAMKACETGLLFDLSRTETVILTLSFRKSDKENILGFTVMSSFLLPPFQENKIGILTISSFDHGFMLGSKTAT